MPTRRVFLQASLAAGVLSGASKTDLAWLSLHEASDLVRRKSVSPVELTQTCLDRIEKLNPSLNAFIAVTAEEALREAREAESEIQNGRWKGPLHGIPIALQDLVDPDFAREIALSGHFEDMGPIEDAKVARRLKAAGAVFLGKLNMHEFPYGTTDVMDYRGAVRNPWKYKCSAGGPSGGSAAAVAAGLCYGALGSGTPSSIRLSASYCGIAGLTPTHNRVSTRGVISLSPMPTYVGPMTRSALDAALMLEAIDGCDPLDITVAEAGPARYLGSSSERPRLGVPREQFWNLLDPEIESAMTKALAALSELTSDIREVQIPRRWSRHEIARYMAAYYKAKRGLHTAASVPAATDIPARRHRDTARRDGDKEPLNVSAAFKNIDLLVMPTVPLPPHPLGAWDRFQLRHRNASAFDNNDLPAISIPCGFTKDGLPIGMQIAGPPRGESAVLQLAHAYERATGWHHRHP